jgi:hypothetical protein
MIYKLAAGLALIVTGAWAVSKPGWDSICATLAAIAALAACFVSRTESGQSQNVGTGGIGIQTGRDAHVRDITNKSS